jgi:hypothetical protein
MTSVDTSGFSDTAKVEIMAQALDNMLDWALANRGSEHEFVNCYTYAAGCIPNVIRQAVAVLKLVRA